MAAIFELSPTPLGRPGPFRPAPRMPAPVGAPWHDRRARRHLVGALAVAFAVALVLTVAAAASWWPSAGAPTRPPASRELVVVGPGDTLWSIAEEHFPPARLVDAVQAMEALNGPTADLRPGDVVALPELR